YELPPDARNLARSPLYEQQAFRWGDLVYGIQFHLEFTDTIIGRLVAEPESREFITGAGVDPARLVAEPPARLRELVPIAQRVYSTFFRQWGLGASGSTAASGRPTSPAARGLRSGRCGRRRPSSVAIGGAMSTSAGAGVRGAAWRSPGNPPLTTSGTG